MNARYCSCGASITISGPAPRVQAIVDFWLAEHTGKGHKLCSKEAAVTARSGDEVRELQMHPAPLTPTIKDDF